MRFNKYFEYASSIGFTDVEFKVKSSKKLSIGVFHQKVTGYTVAECETILIRGIVDGKMVSGMSEDKTNLCDILDAMKKNATLIDEKKEEEIFGGSPSYKNKKLANNEFSSIPVADKIKYCLYLEKKCYDYDSRIKDVQRIGYEEHEESLSIINSKGLKLAYKTSYAVVMVGVVARDGNDTRTGMSIRIGSKNADFDDESFIADACNDALGLLHGTQCESKKYKTILRSDVFASLLRVFLSAVDGDNVNKGRSMLKDKLHQDVAAKKLTVTEDPLCKKYPFFYRAFDDEGVATYKKTIVNKGVLETFLYDLEAAKTAGTKSTGNGYGDSQIGVETAFVSVKPGKKSLEELAASVKNGVLITSLAGLHAGMNPLSGNFSLQANGYLIENGKIGTPLNLITVAGNLYEMFRDIREVGGDAHLSPSGIECPSVVIGKLAVSGK